MIERIDTTERLSSTVKHNGVVYLSGQFAEDDTQNFEHQTTSMFAKIDKLLEAAGSDRSHILSAIIYLKTTADYAEFNTIWNNWLPDGTAPTRTCVQAEMARDNMLVEVSIIAAEK